MLSTAILSAAAHVRPTAATALRRRLQNSRQGNGGAAAGRQLLPAASRTGGPIIHRDDEEGLGRDFASSLALMVLGASLLSERLNGQGLLVQLQLDDHPIIPIAVAAALALATVWPSSRKLATATDVVRDVAGRAAFGGLSLAVSAELWSNKGLLSLLEVDTGVGVISEAEAILAGLLLLVLTGPRKPAA